MNRFKNYGLWVSVAALIPMILKGFNVNILPSNYDEIISGILSVLVMAGILSNPSIGKGYTDQKEQLEERVMYNADNRN